MTFIVSFYSSYFFCCLGFLCIPNRDTWLLLDFVIAFVISVGSYNILFD